ncbi:MAG: SpoIID/LytB domain-containing protein [Gemmatimonadales bacterium]
MRAPDRGRAAVAAAVGLALLTGSCAPPEPVLFTAPAPVSLDPEYRVGLLVNVHRATIGSGGGLRIEDPDEGDIRQLDAGASFDAVTRGPDVALLDTRGAVSRPVLVIEPVDRTGTLRLNGRDYRGALELRRSDSGLTVINRIPLEEYVAGVVGAELGQRAPGEMEALKAQAIASRTYAIRNQGRWKQRGYDLASTTSDQVYAGEAADNSLAVTAAAATRGEILTWNGQPIDAFYFSTCGGRTEDGAAAFAGAARPYLHSIDDVDPSGTPWCAGSPRFHWTAGWTAGELAATLRRTLPPENLPTALASGVTDLRIIDRTRTGRVASLALANRNGRVVITGQAIRRVLSPADGGPLRSADFTIRISRSGGRIERVDIDGRGNGHAVGMCQWGAIGRARAGQDYRTILASYFPGTDIQRLY